MGNCGVGFAPVHAQDHDILINLMEGVEDIPGAALHEGLPWNWESFPQYLDALDSIPHDVDVGAQLPHGALRVYVMGERGRNREAATGEDLQEMRLLTTQAVIAGALGFSTTRTIAHRTKDNDLTPSYGAARQELAAIARAWPTPEPASCSTRPTMRMKRQSGICFVRYQNFAATHERKRGPSHHRS